MTDSAGCPSRECQTSRGVVTPRNAEKRDRKAIEERKAALDLTRLDYSCLR
jgi:hypothetical protein